MARMIPPQIGRHTDPPPGEVSLFQRFKKDISTSGWTVLHSLDIARHHYQVSGEIDFVIIVPEAGVLCLEVKSHQHIIFDNGRWLYGEQQKPGRSPFRQIRGAMHSLLDDLKSKHPELGHVPFWEAVCFPNAVLRSSSASSSPEWHDWQLIDSRHLRIDRASKSVKNVLQRARRHLTEEVNARWFDPERASPTRAECEMIAAALRPRFEFFESPASRTRKRNEELRQYTERQFRALDNMSRNPRVFFEGPAGTGKTFLAIEACRRADADEERVLFVCYNRMLGDWLSRETEDLDNVRVDTLHSYMMDTAGICRAPTRGKNSTFWEKELPELALAELLDNSSYRFDRVIMDEAQDLLQPDFLDIVDASLDGGLKYGRWLMTGDFSNQRIYSGRRFNRKDRTLSPEQFLKGYGLTVPRFSLIENCRNTPEIASFIEDATHPDPEYAEVLRPSSNTDPVIRKYDSKTEATELLIDILAEFYDRKIRGESITILSPRRFEESTAGQVTSQPWSQRIRPRGQNGEGYIRHSTIHAFKGLESPAVIVTDIESLSSRHDVELLYIAASRSQEHLFLLVTEEAQRELFEAALQ